MRRFPRLPARLSPLRLLAAISDERNARRLARHLGCSLADARTVYRLARRDGYGAAYETVFPNGAPVRRQAPPLANRQDFAEPPALEGEVSQAPRG